MSLIECDECGKEVSSKANSCPQCGNPMSAVTVEQTSKEHKLGQLIGGLLMCVGVVVFLGGSNSDTAAAGFVLGVGGLLIYVLARINAWWHHG